MTQVEQCETYHEVLARKIEENKGVRGYKAILAKVCACHPSFLSQVLKQSTHITLDQAFLLSEFWHFTNLQKDYFETLVSLARSGRRERIHYLKQKKQDLKEQMSRISSKAKAKTTTINPLEYYTDWITPAVHMALSIDRLGCIESLCERLAITQTQAEQALDKLRRLNLAAQSRTSSKWFSTQKSMFAQKESTSNLMYQKNLRTRLLGKSDLSKNFIHYGGIFSIDKSTAKKIEDTLKEALVASRNKAIIAKEEELYGIHLDMYLF